MYERNSFGMIKSMALRKAAKIIHDSLNDEKRWPPTPQDILKGNTNANTDLLNPITWIIYPRATLDDRGEAVLPQKEKNERTSTCAQHKVVASKVKACVGSGFTLCYSTR